MPKGFTHEMLNNFVELVRAANSGNKERAQKATDGLYSALVEDRNEAIGMGVSPDFYDHAQEKELIRALQEGFPKKELGIQYRVESAAYNNGGDLAQAAALAANEPNLIQRGVLLGELGKLEEAEKVIRDGVIQMLERLPGMYSTSRGTSQVLGKVVTDYKN